MGTTKNLIAGLGGAIALNLLHEALKHKKSTPRIDKVGEEALQKTLEPIDAEIKNEDNLYAATLGADVLSNAMYFAGIGIGGNKNLWARAVTVGLTAGIGAVTLPEPLGLDDEPVAGTTKKKVLTTSYYVFGALVTAALLKAMKVK